MQDFYAVVLYRKEKKNKLGNGTYRYLLSSIKDAFFLFCKLLIKIFRISSIRASGNKESSVRYPVSGFKIGYPTGQIVSGKISTGIRYIPGFKSYL